MTFDGTLASTNTALDGMSFSPDPDFYGLEGSWDEEAGESSLFYSFSVRMDTAHRHDTVGVLGASEPLRKGPAK